MSVQHHPTKLEDSSLIRFLPLRILYKIDEKLALEEEHNKLVTYERLSYVTSR